ncbi:uncharacterized protein Aud_001702 [Aspergillus udagawae]|uniref:Uncharacterized protein n=1 Tax=Aspergillus udagawae TaxID=91492 RepID=A0A8E0QIE5_9EURO|nr:uncharacterized protein Aud_001702 [Aspergillus udagawae]GIC85862.1 hypothetical protein Aud_001702 [Aspergillus udagawae]
MSSQMKDASGNRMVKDDGQPYLIKDSKAMRTRRKEIAQQFNQSPKSIYPYWSDLTQTYTFDVKYGDDPTIGPCATNARVIAYTIIEGSLGAITLCDATFNPPHSQATYLKITNHLTAALNPKRSLKCFQPDGLYITNCFICIGASQR